MSCGRGRESHRGKIRKDQFASFVTVGHAMFRWVADESARQEPMGTVLFALFWSALVGCFCAVIGIGAWLQIGSADWPKVPGTVTASEASGRKRNVWKLEYAYTVAGQDYKCDKYAINPMPVQGEAEVLRHVAAYPIDAAVEVAYNPRNPADAVLRPGLRGCTLWVSLFLAPFVIVGVGMWAGLVRRLRARPAFNPADPRQVTATESGALVIHPELRSRFATFLTCLGLVIFGSIWTIFFIGFGLGLAYHVFEGFLLDPPLLAPASVWAVAIVGSALLTWRAVKNAPLLVVDGAGSVLTFGSRGAPTELPFAAVREVTVSEQVYQRKGGSYVRHRVEVSRTDGGAALQLAEYDARRDADTLADCLRGLLGVTGSDGPAPRNNLSTETSLPGGDA
jgi:hypothetical protein